MTTPASAAIHTPALAAAPWATQPARGQADAAEFFKYHGLWSPGVRLFRSINFRAKALIISAVFLLPIVLLAYSYFTAQNGNIAFSAKERLGVAYARQALPLLGLLQQDRLQAVKAAAKGGPAPAAAPELAPQLARLAAAEQSLGADLGTTAAYAALQTALKAPLPGAPVDAVFAAHEARVQALLNLLGVATDGSNLTLDPDIDTYYLMDAVLFRLPVMQEAVAQGRGLGVAALTAGSITPATLRTVIEQGALLQNNQAALVAGIAKAVAYNAEVKSHAVFTDLVALVDAHHAQETKTVLRAEGVQGDVAAHVAAANAAIAAMGKLSDSALGKLDSLIAQRVDRLEFSRNLCAAVLGCSLALAIYLFYSFRLVLEGGMQEVAYHINAMRDGDLTTHPVALGKDEAAKLMTTLAEMQNALRHVVGQMRGASDNIVSASAQISTGADDLRARTEQSASSLESTASAMEQIAATVRNNESTVSEVTRLASSNAQTAAKGGEIIAEVVKTMQAINASSGRIGDIIGTIDGIAFQTNILALNAAVEAARAGEQGRGFAVVASEVRALAQRSSAAAREIKTLITHSVQQVENGVRVVKEAGTSISAVVTSSVRVRELLEEVAVGAREQTLGIAQSAKAVTELDTATQQNTTLVDETVAAAGTLQHQANDLATEVARFKLPA
jgi:methyl-accepting chemotaxis protein